MNKLLFLVLSSLMLPACFFGTTHEVVYYPAEKKQTTVIVEEYDSYPVAQTTYITYDEYFCDPIFEDYYTPFYHDPSYCTDYGQGVGYCCTWDYVDVYSGLDCASEWCFWEDICEWDPIIDECYNNYYSY